MKKICITVLFMVFLIASLVFAADQGKIAISAEGKTTAAKVSGVAARSAYFLIFDETGKWLEAVENPYRTSGGSAGSEVVTFLSQKGMTKVVAGDFGKNMIQAMKGKGITYLEFKGSAEEAVKKVLQEKK
ncbi:MAG: hypothetical protein JW943_11925 [Deltaproteobacteria bacterium]|nr:hypothetical protein [Deltaproteobacteria bacterium]